MNTNKIIQDYGKTVPPELYIKALQGHQYIPQSDQCIKNLIYEYISKSSRNRIILDVGCGPGRLTSDIALQNKAKVTGIDISESFVEYARVKLSSLDLKVQLKLHYFCRDFGLESFPGYSMGMADVVLMQGVMHHMHGSDRPKILQSCHDALNSLGILIVGDEFIRNYVNEKQRRYNAGLFYLHIIGEAVKGGFDELAEEEAKNLIDDYFSGTQYAGH